MRVLTIGKNDAGQRLDKFLQKTLKTLPMPLLYKSIRKKKIKVNRGRCEPGQILCEGDTVQLFLAEEFFTDPEGEQAFLHLTPRISVVYEDENILLVEKKPGMIVHSDDEQSTDTLIDHVKAYLYRKGEYDPEAEQSFAPALCNRIDRNTGGIVIAAKTAEGLRVMNEKIRLGQVRKRYLLAAHGHFAEREGCYHGWIIKNGEENKVQVYREKPRFGDPKECKTLYRVLREKGEGEGNEVLTLLEAELLTGRTHQIRAQFSAAGHPLLGDGKYGVNKSDREMGYKFQALYAYRISFPFEGDDGVLSDLRGKHFQVADEGIYFLREFDDGER